MIKKWRVSLFSDYLCIAHEHRFNCKKCAKEFEELEAIGVEDNQLDRHEQKIEAAYQGRERSTLISITFSAMALEAFLYDYGAHHLGDNFVKDHLDKLDTCSKLIVIPKLRGIEGINKGNNLYENVKKIILVRNSLVHYKSKAFELNDLAKATEYHEKMYTKYRELVDYAAPSVESIIEKLGRI